VGAGSMIDDIDEVAGNEAEALFQQVHPRTPSNPSPAVTSVLTRDLSPCDHTTSQRLLFSRRAEGWTIIGRSVEYFLYPKRELCNGSRYNLTVGVNLKTKYKKGSLFNVAVDHIHLNLMC
jgi:hypothetical protein